jgi:hypothetical protein
MLPVLMLPMLMLRALMSPGPGAVQGVAGLGVGRSAREMARVEAAATRVPPRQAQARRRERPE